MSRPAALDLLPSEIEADLRATVRAVLADLCPPAAVTALADGDRTVVGPLWSALSRDLGLAGLLVPESHGGAGATAREAAAVLTELGRAVAPVPYLTSAVIATTALLDGDGDLLAALAAGNRVATLVLPVSAGPYDEVPVLSCDAAGCVSGSVASVAGAVDADTLLVLVATRSGRALAAVDALAASVTPVISLDMSRQLADVTLARAPARIVVSDGEPAVRRALLAGAVLLASEQVGLARWCLEETVAYLKVRTQFGRVVGGFQALKHRLADLYVEIESASAAAVYAAVALAAADPDLAVGACVAQSYCSEVAVRAAEEAVQLHGGIGMTWEHPLHLYLKRAKADQITLGGPGSHRAHLAKLINLPGAIS